MENRPITPTSKDISPEEIDKAVEKFIRKFDRRPDMLYLNSFDLRMLKQICAYTEIIETKEGFQFMGQSFVWLTFIPTERVVRGGWYLADRPISDADEFNLAKY